MSTRSNIGIIDTDGTVKIIYCHFDGYPSHQLPILNTFNEKDFRDLIALGSLSQLGTNIHPLPGVEHSWKYPANDTVVAYHRDRGEKYYPAHVVELKNACEEEYVYLYDVNKQKLQWKSRGNTWSEDCNG